MWEMEQGRHYDHHVINDDLDDAVKAVDQMWKQNPEKPVKSSEMLDLLIRQARERFDRTT